MAELRRLTEHTLGLLQHLGVSSSARVMTIYIVPNRLKGAGVNAPHFSVIISVRYKRRFFYFSTDGSDWSMLKQWNPKIARFSVDEEAIQARLVDGRAADLVILGKTAEDAVSAIRELAQTNRDLEAERRSISNRIRTVELGIERSQREIEERERQIAEIESLPNH